MIKKNTSFMYSTGTRARLFTKIQNQVNFIWSSDYCEHFVLGSWVYKQRAWSGLHLGMGNDHDLCLAGLMNITKHSVNHMQRQKQ